MNPKRPVGIIQVDKEKQKVAKKVAYEIHGDATEYDTAEEVQVIECIGCRLEELGGNVREVNRGLLTKHLGQAMGETYSANSREGVTEGY